MLFRIPLYRRHSSVADTEHDIQGDTIDTMTDTPERAEFTSEMEQQLEDLGRRFQEMEIEQMKKGEVEARQKLEAAKKSVTEKRNEFENQLRRARKVSDDAWDDVSEKLRGAWTEMKEAVDRARAEFDGENVEEEDAS
ncbi:MAG TPA: hypothetical protein VKA74_01010 [Myxococcota bacterium]|nr:hypothetical protein [Myxococcota bacterium]